MKLTVQNLSVTLDNDAILQGVSLQVEDGEFISLLGTSGCGKTTLLKTISGILSPQSGSVSLGDEDITNLPAHKRGTVVLFQDLRLFPHMTVLENVAFAQKMLGVPKVQRLRDAEEFLSLVQLDGYGHRRVNQLSGGQQQRVALARALAARPKVLLLDEPFSALDEALRQEMPEAEFWLIMGADMFLKLESWKEARRIFATCSIAALCREKIDDGTLLQHHAEELNRRYGADCRVLRHQVYEVSSTSVRDGDPATDGRLPQKVCDYIRERGLYGVR